jgi:hypothetical protein
MVGRRSPPSARPGAAAHQLAWPPCPPPPIGCSGRRVRCRRSQCGVDSPRGGSPPTAPGLPGPVARPKLSTGTGRPHRGLRPQAAQHQLSGAVQPALRYEQGSSSCRARVVGDWNTMSTGTHRQAGAVRHSPTNPGRPQAGLFDPGLLDMTLNPPCRATVRPTGVVTTRFVHRGVPRDDDGQIHVDQCVCGAIPPGEQRRQQEALIGQARRNRRRHLTTSSFRR